MRITTCLCDLLSGLDYAIERNIEMIDIPLEGDVDILITFAAYQSFIKRAWERGVVLSVARVFGGSRVFIACSTKLIKRIDFMWHIHYRGIIMAETQELLALREPSSEGGLYTLPINAQVRIVYYIKNAYGGAEKYRSVLEQQGYGVLDRLGRRIMLKKAWLSRPLRATYGMLFYWMSYLRRVIVPSGLTVAGVNLSRLKKNKILNYLFQTRIYEEQSIFLAMLRSRFMSELCLTKTHGAALQLLESMTDEELELAILAELRSRESNGH